MENNGSSNRISAYMCGQRSVTTLGIFNVEYEAVWCPCTALPYFVY